MDFQYTQALTNLTIAAFLTLALLLPANAENPTAYDVLEDYDFPIGILPKGVVGYDLDKSTGKFSAYLNGACSFSLEGSYQLSYKSTINGFLSKGKLSNLEGVKVKLLWIWVDIVEVTRMGDDLEFSVGIASAGFPIDNFEECPQCGCGLNCDDGLVCKNTSHPLEVQHKGSCYLEISEPEFEGFVRGVGRI